MANLTVRNVPDNVHRALRARAQAHGQSAEAEVRQILGEALLPDTRIRVGDALSSIGRDLDLSDEDVAALESNRDPSPAEPITYP